MEIDAAKCVGCGNCVPFCTMGAIRVENDVAVVNEDECVECSTCYRCCGPEGLRATFVRGLRRLFRALHLRYDAPLDVCPTGALVPPELKWPRSLRRAFSDPTVTHDSTGMAGRGTEEIKTNDITGRIGPGEAGIVIDLGRPGTGVFFRDIDTMTRALAQLDVFFEPQNPLTHLMNDPQNGSLRKDIANEKVLSAIIELKIKLADLPEVLHLVEKTATALDTVISVGVSTKCDPEGGIPHESICSGAGYPLSLNGKTNLGLGRPVEGMS
ncbi:MAG: 4Fe-4S ferredoxin [Candidatus Abyssobacteria bacterium SURF_5]|uniref:4Fe-4S ferredoxin n=1 Tax=Abyssobacteria bacterium (strain SURF_5) TaxID=2093360 RepID=A0A3A4NK00_ABYX5|nr:MAG: 4Fe-4S ferredoxin [Candidatus Abyssubacteria bacterium SURF_5]